MTITSTMELKVGADTYDKLERLGWMLDCTPAAALEEVVREFRFESPEDVSLIPPAERTESTSPWRPFWIWVGYASGYIGMSLIAVAVVSGLRQKPVPRATLEGQAMAWGILIGLGLLVFLLFHACRSLKAVAQ